MLQKFCNFYFYFLGPMEIQFTSDTSTFDRGFKLRYDVIGKKSDVDCGETNLPLWPWFSTFIKTDGTQVLPKWIKMAVTEISHGNGHNGPNVSFILNWAILAFSSSMWPNRCNGPFLVMNWSKMPLWPISKGKTNWAILKVSCISRDPLCHSHFSNPRHGPLVQWPATVAPDRAFWTQNMADTK